VMTSAVFGKGSIKVGPPPPLLSARAYRTSTPCLQLHKNVERTNVKDAIRYHDRFISRAIRIVM
jgi:hypothetical protein